MNAARAASHGRVLLAVLFSLTAAACSLQDMLDRPTDIPRTEAQRLLSQWLQRNSLPKIHDRYEVRAFNGIVIGYVTYDMAYATEGGRRVYRITSHTRIGLHESAMETHAESVFDAAAPFALRRYSHDSTEPRRIRITRTRDATFPYVMATQVGEGRADATRLPYAPLTLADEVGDRIWAGLRPAVGSRLMLQSFEPTTLLPHDIEVTAVRCPPPSPPSAFCSQIQYNPANPSEPELYQWRGLHVARISPWHLGELNLLPAGAPLPDPAGTRNFYLPRELPRHPEGENSALAATVQICTSGSCGSGAFVSNEGHLLTARHVICSGAEESTCARSGIVIPEFAGLAAAEVLHISDGRSDYALLKITVTDSHARAVIAGHGGLACIPMAPSPPAVGDALWAMGFPGYAEEPTGSHHPSDGRREMITAGTRIDVANEDVLQWWERLRTPVSESMVDQLRADSEFHGDFAGLPGMSGGPVIDQRGRLTGLLVNGMQVLPGTAEPMAFASAGVTDGAYLRRDVTEALGEAAAGNAFRCEAVHLPAPPTEDPGRYDGERLRAEMEGTLARRYRRALTRLFTRPSLAAALQSAAENGANPAPARIAAGLALERLSTEAGLNRAQSIMREAIGDPPAYVTEPDHYPGLRRLAAPEMSRQALERAYSMGISTLISSEAATSAR